MAKPLDLSKAGTPATPDAYALYDQTFGTYKDEVSSKSDAERLLSGSLPMTAGVLPAKGLKAVK